MFEVTYKMADYFFDRAIVDQRLAKQEARAMSRIGAFIRTSAKQSIRRRKSVSQPGSPPSAHSSDKIATLKNIPLCVRSAKAFGCCRTSETEPSQSRLDQLWNITVPRLMEAGGVVVIKEERWKPTREKEYPWRRRDLRRKGSENKEYRQRRAIYKARPFMAPALERERRNGKLINAWKEMA